MLYNQDGSISVTAVAGDRPVGMYAQASSAVNSETFTVFKRNGVLTNTSAQVAACFTGGSMTASQWQNLYTSLYNYLREVGATTW